jgi:hypothetical protein
MLSELISLSIRNLLKRKKWTQLQPVHVGLDRSRLADVDRRQAQYPILNLELIAQALGVTRAFCSVVCTRMCPDCAHYCALLLATVFHQEAKLHSQVVERFGTA